jgi:hypothetical protein
VNELKKRYNDLRHVAQVRERELELRSDELRTMERSTFSEEEQLQLRVRIRPPPHPLAYATASKRG